MRGITNLTSYLNTPVSYTKEYAQYPNLGVSTNSFFTPVFGKDINIQSFTWFIKSRTQYLDSLKCLGDNWISGNSKQPTDTSLNVSKSILLHLNYWYNQEGFKNFINPKIIMSPTPKGGISLEIILGNNLKALVDIFDESIEVEVEKNGYFFDTKSDNQSINDTLTGLYNEYSQYCDTRFGNSL